MWKSATIWFYCDVPVEAKTSSESFNWPGSDCFRDLPASNLIVYFAAHFQLYGGSTLKSAHILSALLERHLRNKGNGSGSHFSLTWAEDRDRMDLPLPSSPAVLQVTQARRVSTTITQELVRKMHIFGPYPRPSELKLPGTGPWELHVQALLVSQHQAHIWEPLLWSDYLDALVGGCCEFLSNSAADALKTLPWSLKFWYITLVLNVRWEAGPGARRAAFSIVTINWSWRTPSPGKWNFTICLSCFVWQEDKMKQWMLKWFENVSMQREMWGGVRMKECL